MIICGLKLTHDGSIAVIDDGKLIFSIELEKINNNPRYTSIEDTYLISEILKNNGYEIRDIDYFAIDGWGGYDQEALAIQPRLKVNKNTNVLTAYNKGNIYNLDIAQYREKLLKHSVLQEWRFDGLKIGAHNIAYYSYLHVTGHIMSAYCTSPFARNNESSFILVWDGGMYPRAYYFDVSTKTIENLGPLFLLIGNIYTIFSQHFGPFKVEGNFAKDDLSIAGKVMAYIALGECRKELYHIFNDIYVNNYNNPMGFANIFANEVKRRIGDSVYSDEDILNTFHYYLEDLLINKLKKKISKHKDKVKNLCFVGGCALNIKWNMAIRKSGIFNQVYVPPFPNDSGSAIGVACASMYHRQGNTLLKWNVYSGPQILNNGSASGWIKKACSIKQLARIIHENNEPVVFFNSRSELGPRALGNRSILAPANTAKMKDVLNYVKKREPYRPVSPICLEEKAPVIFDPGTSDPYMLFDHMVRPEWLEKIPAVCHLDGSSRLQTVNFQQNELIAELLIEYEKHSGIPLLCNTSANLNGKGFFPDVLSATQWGRLNYVWCENALFEKRDKINLFSLVDTEALEIQD